MVCDRAVLVCGGPVGFECDSDVDSSSGTGKACGTAKGSGNLKQTFEQAGSWRLGVITVTYFIAIAGFAIVTVIYPQVSHRRFELNQSQISLYFCNDRPDRRRDSGRRHRQTRQAIW